MIFMLGIVILSGCKQSSPLKSEPPILPQNKVAIHAKPVSQIKIKREALILAKTIHPIQPAFIYTHCVGTLDHPTINGGIINSTEGVDLDGPSKGQGISQQKAKSVLMSSNEPPQKSFNDEWATNERVRRLLLAASRHGKLDYVLKKTDQMKLPASVAVVPMIESNYDKNAISPKGAIGAWQLMPSIAKEYGIQDQDRFQFATSTDTALTLLNDLHQQFDNWELAFAAYNAGSKRVSDAIQKNPSATSIDELALPHETKRYVERIREVNKKIRELAPDV